MDLVGKVIKILPPLSGISQKSGEKWVRNSFVIETNDEYPKKCVFTVFGEDKWQRMGIVVGATYNVSFDVDAREFNGKWFNDVQAWFAKRLDEQNGGGQQSEAAPAKKSKKEYAQPAGEGDEGDLPF